jgi:hypothetical protein
MFHDKYATREEIAKDNARAAADELKERQIYKATVKKWINEKLDTMDPEDISFMYTMSSQVPELRAFFKVFKELQKGI